MPRNPWRTPTTTLPQLAPVSASWTAVAMSSIALVSHDGRSIDW